MTRKPPQQVSNAYCTPLGTANGGFGGLATETVPIGDDREGAGTVHPGDADDVAPTDVREVRGTLEIGDAPGGGTQVTLTLPGSLPQPESTQLPPRSSAGPGWRWRFRPLRGGTGLRRARLW